MTTFLHVCAAAYQTYRQKSQAKYPTWDTLESYEQHQVIRNEFDELEEAYKRGDVYGPHGMIAESIDCIVVLVRRIMELSKGGGK